MEDCISYVHEEEEETAGAWDGVVLEVRGSIARERQLVTLHHGPAEERSSFFMLQIVNKLIS